MSSERPGRVAGKTAIPAKRPPGGFRAIRTDLSRTDEIEEMVARTAWDLTLNVGLKAVFLASKYGIPVRRTGGGAIINTGSVHSLAPPAPRTTPPRPASSD